MSTSIQQNLEKAALYVLGDMKSPHMAEPLTSIMARGFLDRNDNLVLRPDSGGHIVTHSPKTSPTVATGAGIGTGGSPAATLLTGSNDRFGILRIVTGSSAGTTSATLATVTFNKAFDTAPIIKLSPHNAAAAALAVASQVYPASESTTGFLVKTNGSALGTSTTYDFVYEVLA